MQFRGYIAAAAVLGGLVLAAAMPRISIQVPEASTEGAAADIAAASRAASQGFLSLTDYSALEELSVTPTTNYAWLEGGMKEPLPFELPARWSPFWWSVNAAAVLGHKGDLPKDAIERLAERLTDVLNAHTQHVDDSSLVFYDFTFKVGEMTLTPPWYSALGNAYAALGLMNLGAALDDETYMAAALQYLIPIPSQLSYELDGDLWFGEYVTSLDDRYDVGVINGHFTALAALQEWRIRTGDTRFDQDIERGLRTLDRWLPIVHRGSFTAYARDMLWMRDYGQERAMNQAQAACLISSLASLCDTARHYRETLPQ